jgi:hypothetical protein
MKSSIAILALLCTIPLADASEILFATDTNGDLIIINPVLQASALVGTNPDGISPIGITAQGVGPSKLWVFDNGTNNFIQLNNNNAATVSTVFTAGGSALFNDTVNEGDLVFTGATNGFLAGIPSFGSTMTAFYSWDTTGANTSLYNGLVTGDTAAGQHAQMSGLAFCANTIAGICTAGTLFGLEKPTDGFHLFTVNQADGSILTSVPVTGISGSYSVGGLAINPITGEAFVEYSNLSGTAIASINLTTGVTSSPFAILPGQISLVNGLTFADEGNALPTPEPATALLLCIGAVAIGLRLVGRTVLPSAVAAGAFLHKD